MNAARIAGVALAPLPVACGQGAVGRSSQDIYGGQAVDAADPIARSTVALFSGSDHQTGHAIVDGSATGLRRHRNRAGLTLELRP